jgi:hypothetical protein
MQTPVGARPIMGYTGVWVGLLPEIEKTTLLQVIQKQLVSFPKLALAVREGETRSGRSQKQISPRKPLAHDTITFID